MKISNFRHKLAFKRVVRFKVIQYIYFFTGKPYVKYASFQNTAYCNL